MKLLVSLMVERLKEVLFTRMYTSPCTISKLSQNLLTFKQLGNHFKESIPPACVTWQASPINLFVVLARQATQAGETESWNRFLGSLNFTNSGSVKIVTKGGHGGITYVLCSDVKGA
jgi:hypothetical protein